MYRLSGLTPGASYAVYVDQILAGGFSTPPISLPGPEEFYNGAAESSDSTTDDPSRSPPSAPRRAASARDIDVIFNAFRPGDHAAGRRRRLRAALPDPFPFSLCGQELIRPSS